METGLRLLMRDGAMYVRFHPRLTAEQYSELVLLVEKPATKAELRSVLEEFAKRWRCEVEFED
jgi:hypothetical protein